MMMDGGGMEEIRRQKRRIAPPTLSASPLVPLPYWQRVVTSVARQAEVAGSCHRSRRVLQRKLAADLERYTQEAQMREERQRQAQRESRARLGEQLTTSVHRFWRRRADVFQRLFAIDFEVTKRQHDFRKQEDLLRETEELTKRLIDSILSRKNNNNNKNNLFMNGGDDDDGNEEVGGGATGATSVEASLSLLDTQDGERPLRHYQRSALQWMIHLFDNNLNGILADEMGLGKTVQTIALLCHYAEHKNDWGPHLIVVPTTVVLNWRDELRRWAPGLRVLTYLGSAKERHHLRKGWMREDAFHVCITSYNLVVQDRAVFRRRPWGFLVLDEAHQVKSFMSKKWTSLFDLQAEYRLLLTGTPLQNSIMELWSLFHFLLPFASAFRSNDDFREWFSNPMDAMISGRSSLNEDIVRRLQALIRPFMLRRLKRDVESQLPTKMEKVVMCSLSKRQRLLYDEYMQLAETRQKLRVGGPGGILGVLLALRKVCNHPDLFEERPTQSPLTLDRQAEIVMHVPRCILLLHNDRPRRFSFHICDVNGDGAHTPGSHDSGGDEDDALWSWMPPRVLEPFLLFASPVVEAERFSPMHFDASSSTSTINTPSLGAMKMANAASFILSPDLLHSSTQPLVHATHLRLVRHATTRCIQQQRYLDAQRGTCISFPTSCRWSLVSHMLQHHFPKLCPTISQRAAASVSLIQRVALYIPAIHVAHAPRLACSRPVSHFAAFRYPTREDVAPLVCYVDGERRYRRQHPLHLLQLHRHHHHPLATRRAYDASFVAEELWPMHIRRCFFIPDRRLLIHDCGKLQYLEPLLKRLRHQGHRVLIFTQFVQMLNVLERFLAVVGVSYLRLDGSTRAELRQLYVDRFNADVQLTCMILSTRSGGIGLNLTGADTVIFYDSDWNPTMDLQAQDRCHRIGQTRPVTIYRLISEHTVEESILEKARERKRLNNVVIRGGQFDAMAEVQDAYDDSASAFAALSNPVNLRSFFHDLDEDAAVEHTTSSSSSSMMMSEESILKEMEKVEDAEDREAQRQVQLELDQRAKEERELECGEEEDGTTASVNDGGASATLSSSMDVHAIVERYLPLCSSNNSDVHANIRKRQRDAMLMESSAANCLLSLRYGVCHEAEARARYHHFQDACADQLDEAWGKFPRFRADFSNDDGS